MTENKPPEEHKPKDLPEQIRDLQTLKANLQLEIDGIEGKIKSIESAFSENNHLRGAVAELIETFKKLNTDVWSKKSEFFPDIYLNMLLRLNEKFNPPKK